MTEQLLISLKKKFETHRIVFWYDEKKELEDVFASLELSEVVKEKIENNEFQLKYRILRENKDQKFLLYHNGSAPDEKDNWLLDVQLSHTTFRADKVSFLLIELGLSEEFRSVIENHKEFYDSAERKAKFIQRKTPSIKPFEIPEILISIITKGETIDWYYFIISFLDEHSRERNETYQLLGRCNLQPIF